MKKKTKNAIIIGLVVVFLLTVVIAAVSFLGGIAKVATLLSPKIGSVNNEVIQSNIPATEINGKPCNAPSDCGLDGCLQQGAGGNVCNGRHYECVLGKCKVTDNLFVDYYCTEFGCEDICGNTACELKYGETVANCATDCLGKFQ